VGLAAGRNAEALAAQARESGVGEVAIFDASREAELRSRLGDGVRVRTGAQGLAELASEVEADIVLVAIVGTDGLRPALAAIEAGRDLAVASKEILVMAGEVVTEAAKRRNVELLPVDSEHNAIFQCLEGQRGGPGEVKRLVLTASGGPFRTWPAERLAEVTVEQALNHPTWDMGPKITIDSATLFNKGLEMIEARWLFDIEMERIDVVVHPQSIVHSMVEFIDGSVLAQMSHTDMCFPIQYALTWPERVPGGLEPLDFAELAKLEFEAPRAEDFPALGLARRAGTLGGTMPAVFNAANEVAVEAFRARRISFPGIWQLVGGVMEAHETRQAKNLDVIEEADRWAREKGAAMVSGI
jgi:1-deoxy-D-xylulose-5-phosphate reductoisomerase